MEISYGNCFQLASNESENFVSPIYKNYQLVNYTKRQINFIVPENYHSGQGFEMINHDNSNSNDNNVMIIALHYNKSNRM